MAVCSGNSGTPDPTDPDRGVSVVDHPASRHRQWQDRCCSGRVDLCWEAYGELVVAAVAVESAGGGTGAAEQLAADHGALHSHVSCMLHVYRKKRVLSRLRIPKERDGA